ncbi:hypothetical protein PV327_003779 [Microctonus hyperodae]|uniref:Matrin-type domain-containing protein n=1 Tax=Microctonus hyperodae TaxID=165561 RepID=A0AA39G4N8_MICHY|nr:hypothetical protein PV327_003779 [Microctonus hyperodae]
MADYWKSQDRKFCDFCKCWIADNKPSIEFHEGGKKHKENVAKRLKEMHRNSAKSAKMNKKFEKSIETMEKAAMAAYKKDVEENSLLDITAKEIIENKHKTNDQLSNVSLIPNEMSIATPGVNLRQKETQLPELPNVRLHPNQMSVATPRVNLRQKKSQLPEHVYPYGPWQTVEIKSAEDIDLELPKKQIQVSQPIRSEPFKQKAFAEKTITKISADSSDDDDALTIFKKRKFGNRNIRGRFNDD